MLVSPIVIEPGGVGVAVADTGVLVGVAVAVGGTGVGVFGTFSGLQFASDTLNPEGGPSIKAPFSEGVSAIV